MASSVNRVVLVGNLTRDPELKTTAGGLAICNMRIAVNTRVKRDGEWTEKANFFDVVAFGAQGENCNKYLSKGRPIALDGRLDWQEWTTDGGDKRQRVQIIADSVQFLDSGSRESQEPADEPEPDFTSSAATSTPAEDDIPF